MKILKISGCSKTNLISCINGTLSNYDETYSTLMFASRAMKIRVNAQINEEIHFKVIFILKSQRKSWFFRY